MSARPMIVVSLGPLSSESVVAWAGNAARFLDMASEETEAAPPLETMSDMHDVLREWMGIALANPTFEWRRSVYVDNVASFVRHWYELRCLVLDESRRGALPVFPPVGQEFYDALLAAAFDALERAGEPYATAAAELRARWPQ
jgi:hypothetical protein